ncbi:CRISPR-associated endonuclease Cas1 [Caldifermentibacillus hisashii]|uniref:CRISPR-associated endonuclease Cas1 n=1 Tax=Caldifermentibacillus hisashii TaxID=996558 RepID=A0ABU9K1Z2_9BACI|nr:CRISPR-associated endonuclease Cas1 [Caldibacillus thermoamylovorans]KIO69857.1 hypothetical protein B4064_1140 [Caldibacillus thermoamylovorans]
MPFSKNVDAGRLNGTPEAKENLDEANQEIRRISRQPIPPPPKKLIFARNEPIVNIVVRRVNDENILYIFTSGELKRKDNSLYFESENGRKYISVEDTNDIYIFGEVDVIKRFLELALIFIAGAIAQMRQVLKYYQTRTKNGKGEIKALIEKF